MLLLAIGCQQAEPQPSERFANDPEAIARGEAIFRGVCGAYCHALVPDNRDALYLFDCEWKHGASDAEIFAVISGGVPGTRMVGFGESLSEEDLWKVIAFLRSKADC
jgi:mono/diheme cytochrome c family protein